jgi:adenylate kinase family enzyme
MKKIPKTIIFIGNSGCGKGTQANLIEKKFKDNGEKVFHLETGNEFRDLLNMTTYTAELARGVSERGELQPEFLAVKM